MTRVATIRKDQSDGGARTRQPAADRRKAMLAAAREVFLERGYANSSIDAVVERSGGSKATVYQLFGNKEGLLAALVAEGAEELAHLVDALPLDGGLEDSLKAFARGYLSVVLRPERLGLFRLVVGESSRVPELGDVFYRSGPQSCGKGMTRFFGRVMEHGVMRRTDPERAAFHFIHALRGDLYMQVLLNPTRAPTPQEIDQHIDFVVGAFLDGYRV
jgi:AcrR family transcriptional regulator